MDYAGRDSDGGVSTTFVINCGDGAEFVAHLTDKSVNYIDTFTDIMHQDKSPYANHS